MSDKPRRGWYDLIREGQDFQVDSKAEIKWFTGGPSGSTSLSPELTDRL